LRSSVVSILLTAMDMLLKQTVHKRFLNTILVAEFFTDLDYAEDVGRSAVWDA